LNPINFIPVFTMRTTQQLSITLPTEMAGLVKSKVASGDYATESEVIRDGLRVLMARDRAIEQWLASQVGPAHDALAADPARAIPIDQVRQRLAEVHRVTTAKP
jgi:antitoxin ParD1/3/4